MFRYAYSDAGPGNPPAAFVLINVQADIGGEWVENLPALADTGADQTVLPDTVLGRLGVQSVNTVQAVGVTGGIARLPVYAVRLCVRDLPPIGLDVLGGWSEPYAVLGRDVLNRYRVVFDGPNLRLEIG